MTTYEIRNGIEKEADFTFYGGARNAVRCKDPEVMLHGPAETGKTISWLNKLHLCACKYPNASIVIMRKTQTSTYPSVIKTFCEKVISDELESGMIQVYGGEMPRWFDYIPNGSRIWVAGMDKASRVLSSEHDIIFANQAEEFGLDEWEHLTTRTTGRAGNMPYAQTIGDMNPTYPQHWPYNRDSLQTFPSKHEDNPILFDPETGKITEQGERTLQVLKALTGARRARLLEGIPTQVEGAIYTEWNEAIHYLYPSLIPKCFRYVAGIDWGYKNPGCLGIFGIDGRDGNLYLRAQHYHTMKTDDWWLERALELNEEFVRTRIKVGRGEVAEHLIEAWICDPSQPAYIEKFRRAGLNAIAGFNGVIPGINAVKTRLANEALFIVRDSLRMLDHELDVLHKPTTVQDEFAGYAWADNNKEVPIKERDHGLDMTRYVVCYVDDVGSEQDKPAGAW